MFSMEWSSALPDQKAEVDLLVRSGDGDWIPIEVKWAGEGWPADVRAAVERVPEPWPPNLVLVARQLSPGAIEWLRERGANWADEAGQARIIGPGGMIVIREPARPQTVETHGLTWSPSGISVAEVVLARPDRPLRTAALAEETGWSVPQVGSVLQVFDAEGWTAKRGPARGPRAHRELVDPDRLLSSWSQALAERNKDTRVAHRATRDIMAWLRRDLRGALDRRVKWAVSGWAALELVAPLMTTVPGVHVYVADGDFAGPLTAAIGDAGLREVPEGGRAHFWRADDRLFKLAARGQEGVPVVSAPRLYADLSAFGGRGLDAAEHLKRELIDPLRPAGGDGNEEAGDDG